MPRLILSPARLKDMLMGLLSVLRAAAGPWEYYPGTSGQYAAGPQDEYEWYALALSQVTSRLRLTSKDYNTGQTIFYICFLFAELPSQMISKRLGPDRWIPVQMVSWSLIASMQAFLSGRSSFWLCRALLGIWEGGFIPDCVLYLSYYYKGDELPGRLSMFWVSYYITYIVSAFLAYGILHMDGINGLAGWRWIFALEGTLTGVIGIATYFYLPPSPCQTASWFRGKNGWFSEHEEKIMVNRVLRDDPSKGNTGLSLCLKVVTLWLARLNSFRRYAQPSSCQSQAFMACSTRF